MLGAFMTDINLGIYTARLEPARCIYATSERLAIRWHTFENVRFKDFVHGLAGSRWEPRTTVSISSEKRSLTDAGESNLGAKITVERLFQIVNTFLRDDTIVVADVGDALFGAADLFIHQRTEFLGPAYYASMGFAVPAAIGAEIANPALRPLVLVGDGAFQMTGTELSTAVRYGLRPVVIVLNNRGYGTERHMQDGVYNDVLEWRYHKLPEMLGAGQGWLAETEGELVRALNDAEKNTQSFSLIEVRLDQNDRSPALKRLAERLAKRL